MQHLSDLWDCFLGSRFFSFGAIMNTTNTLDLLGFQVFSPMTCWNEVPLCTPIVLYTINIHPQNETLAVQVALIHPDQLPTSASKRKADQIVLFISLVQLVFFKWVYNSHTCFWICFQKVTTTFMLFFHRIPYLRKHWPFFVHQWVS